MSVLGDWEMIVLFAIGSMALFAAMYLGCSSLRQDAVVKNHKAKLKRWQGEADKYRILYANAKARNNQMCSFYTALLYGESQKEIADGAGTTADERAKI